MRILLMILVGGVAFAETKPVYRGHGAESVTPAQAAERAPRPLPPEVSRRIQTMLDLRAPGAGILAPDGKSLWFTWNVTGTQQVWKLDGPRRFPQQMTGGEDLTALADLSPDGKWIVVQRDRKGEENPGLYLLPSTGGPLVLIQHKPNVRTMQQLFSSSAKFLYYSANDLKPDAYALYRYELATQKATKIFDRDGLWAIADERDGKLLLSKATGAQTREYYELDGETLTPLLGVGEKQEYDARYAARAGELIVRTPKGGNFRALHRFSNGKLTPLVPSTDSDVTGFAVDRARKHVVFSRNQRGYEKIEALDAASYKPIALPKWPEAEQSFFGSLSRDGKFAVLAIENSKWPRRAFVFDWKTRATVEWLTPSTPEVDTSKFAQTRLEEFPARDGSKVPMFVRRPSSCQACPIVVHLHGGPEAQSRPGFSPLAQLFVDAGFIWVEPNVRGSEGYGQEYLHADDGKKRLDVITDLEDLAKHLRTWGGKLGVFGWSYGGYSTLMAMTRFAGAYDAGVALVGMSNLVTFLENTAPYRRILRISEYGDPVADREALRDLSPINFIDRVKAPLLLIQGVSDPRVPVGEALQMEAALKARNVPTKLVLFADEGHGAKKRDNRAVEIGLILDFFETHLKK